MKKSTTALSLWFRALAPTCGQVSRIQSDALDQTLPLARRIGLRLHLMICKLCRRYGEQIRFLSRAAHDHPDELAASVPQELSAPARERIKRRLQTEGES